MRNIKIWSLILGAAFLIASLALAQAGSSSHANLNGGVNSYDGSSMEGVAVSARASGETFTTTVYTDQNGRYSFPPLTQGHYRIWAQAVTFEAATAEQDLSGGQNVQQNFTLKALADFSKQVSGDELMASLPEDTPEDRRMKAIFTTNCTGCHQANFPLQNRFDSRGWGVIISFMSKTDPFAAIADPNKVLYPMIQAYREELAGYLAKVRGPNSAPLNYKLVPRPSGEATRVVITEFDLSPGSRPDYILPHNGSLWAEGEPSAHEARAAHDAVVDQQGTVWFTDQIDPNRTLGRLDPRTGKVAGFKLAGKEGTSVRTHGLAVDQGGNVWFTNNEEGSLTKFDPKTESFTRFPRPESFSPVGDTVAEVDSKGNVWAVTEAGAIKLDPRTGKYFDYRSITPGGNPYGLAVDAKDNAWFSQIGNDRLGIVDGRTGKVSELLLKPADDVKIIDRDRQLAARIPGNAVSAAPDSKGPRRLGADPKGDTVWVGEYYADRLAKININTKEVKEYPVPHRYTQPYDTDVDKNHMVWIALMNTDRVAKFDPFTERFTEYPLPTRGTEARYIMVDNRTDPPTVWVPYYRTSKIARIQLRAASTISAAAPRK